MNIFKRQFLFPTLPSALAFSVSQANAQTPGQTEPAEELPAVNVTAERTGSFKSDVVQVSTFRDMVPVDVLQTSNVVTREVLDAQAATTLFGALRNTAGVARTALNGSTYDNIAIRGILVENRGNYRLNGSPPIINLVDAPLENKEGDLKSTVSRDQGWDNENYRAAFGYTANKRSQYPKSFPSTTLVRAQNLYNPVNIPEQSPTVAFTSNPSSIDDRGWYLSDRIIIGEKWQAMVGVRGSDYEPKKLLLERSNVFVMCRP